MMHALPQSGAQMARPSGIVLLVLLSGLLVTDAPSGRSQPASNLCIIPITRVVRIPISILRPQDKADAAPAASLLISTGAVDEPPEGPNGFDVLENGTLLITDPLRNAVSSFNTQGKFLKTWHVGFPADSVTVNDKGRVAVREANTGKVHAFDSEGKPYLNEAATAQAPAEVKLARGENRGTIFRTAAISHGGPLTVELSKPGMTLLSLEHLGTDGKGDTYVALEATGGSDASGGVNLSKYVRRYAGDGRLLCETAELPLSYYVAPVDEIRIHGGVIYQLQTTSAEVRVNLWNTNSLCSGGSR